MHACRALLSFLPRHMRLIHHFVRIYTCIWTNYCDITGMMVTGNHPKMDQHGLKNACIRPYLGIAMSIHFLWHFVPDTKCHGDLEPRVSDYDRDPSRRSPPRGRCKCTFSLQVGLGKLSQSVDWPLSQLNGLSQSCNSRRTSQRL